jgi:DUF1680 family protein
MRAPVVPSAEFAALRPMTAGFFRVRSGPWAERQRLVREVSVPHAVAQMTDRGYLDNFRRLTGAEAPYRGAPWTDSDVYKLLEAAAWLGKLHEEPFPGWVRELSAAQRDDGYLHTWFGSAGAPDRYTDLAMGHEAYCVGHLIQAGVAARRTDGDEALLAIARRAADNLVARFRSDERGLCGHPCIEMALVELSRETDTPSYLALARSMLDRRGRGALGPAPFPSAYFQDDVPLRDLTTFRGHCVRALYLASGMLDVYLETGDRSLLDAVTRQWEATAATKTHLTGGVGSRRKDEAFGASYELSPDRAFAETCAGVASFMCAWRLLLATGDPSYADAMERVLYNVLAAAMSDSGDRFRYVNTLHRRADAPETGDKAMRRQPWFRCACCPTNLLRTFASLDAYVATTTDDGVQLHQYLDGVLDTGSGLVLDVDTDYPRSGRIAISVLSAPTGTVTLGLRVPGWSTAAALTVNGVAHQQPAAGRFAVRRAWRGGDRVELTIDVTPRVLCGDYRVDGVRGCVAVQRGPVVFCLEDADLPGIALAEVTADAAALPYDRADGTVGLAGRYRTPAPTGWPYAPRGADPAATTPIELVLQPYSYWGNRGDGEMRVWLPVD